MDKLQRYREKLAKNGVTRHEFLLMRDTSDCLNTYLEKYEKLFGKKLTRSEVVNRLIDEHIDPEVMNEFIPHDEALSLS